MNGATGMIAEILQSCTVACYIKFILIIHFICMLYVLLYIYIFTCTLYTFLILLYISIFILFDLKFV